MREENAGENMLERFLPSVATYTQLMDSRPRVCAMIANRAAAVAGSNIASPWPCMAQGSFDRRRRHPLTGLIESLASRGGSLCVQQRGAST